MLALRERTDFEGKVGRKVRTKVPGSRYRPRNSRRKARTSLREELFEIESCNVITTHLFASLSTLPVLYFPCLSPVFFFFPSSIFFFFFFDPSPTYRMYGRETFGNFWRDGSFNSASFLRSKLDYMRECSLYVEAWCWKLEKSGIPRQSTRCEHNKIRRWEGWWWNARGFIQQNS